MGWVKDFRVKNCRILTIPDNVFQDFGELNYFGFEGGSVENSVGFNALNGVDVKKMADSQTPRGIASFRNTRFVAGSLQNGFLFPLANVSEILIENCNIRLVLKSILLKNLVVLHLNLTNILL